MLIAIVIKLLNRYDLMGTEWGNLVYLFIFMVPLTTAAQKLGRYFGKKVYNELNDLMETHIFRISLGDTKQAQIIAEESRYKNSAILFVFNIITSIGLPIVFFLLGS